MTRLNQEQLNELIADSTTLISNSFGPKVLLLSNKHCLKFFRLKSWFSSALFYHYADRFVYNANKLAALNIPSLKVINEYSIPKDFIQDSKLTKAVEYSYVEGHSLRDLIIHNHLNNTHAIELGKFVAKLHHLGIYFKACHFGNILYDTKSPNGLKFKLIDIENMKFYNKPLPKNKVINNFKHMTKYDIDKGWLTIYKKDFETGYGQVITF